MGRRIWRTIRWLFIFVVAGIIVAGAVLAWDAFVLPPREQASATLEMLYTHDQAARRAGFADLYSMLALTVGDWQRVQKVHRMVDAQMLTTALDYYYAAHILQHGNEPNDFVRAQQLARQAATLGEPRGRRLSALAEDRYLISRGLPQKYGSQFHCTPEQGWQLHPIDSSVTDMQRRADQMPMLAEQQARAAQIQALTGGQCALTAAMMQEIAAIMDE